MYAAQASLLLLDFLFLLNLLLLQEVEEAALYLGIYLTCTLEGESFTAPRPKKLQIQKVVHKVIQKPSVFQKPASTFTSSSGQAIMPLKKEREMPQEEQTLEETITNGSRVKCSLCQNSFTRQVSLNRHIAKRHKDAKFDCKLCGKHLPSLKKLELHGEQGHPSDKKYSCDRCAKRFVTRTKLKKHKRAHTVFAEHQCDLCQKRFLSNSSLVLHKNIHLEEKPFKCEDCDKGFNQKGNLKGHLQKSHGKELSDVLSESFNNVLVGKAELEGSFSGALKGEGELDKSEVIGGIVSEA